MQAWNTLFPEQKSPSIEDRCGLDAEEFLKLGAKQLNKPGNEDPSKSDDEHSFEPGNDELRGLLINRGELVRHCPLPVGRLLSLAVS